VVCAVCECRRGVWQPGRKVRCAGWQAQCKAGSAGVNPEGQVEVQKQVAVVQQWCRQVCGPTSPSTVGLSWMLAVCGGSEVVL